VGPNPSNPRRVRAACHGSTTPNFGVLVFEQFLDQATVRRIEELVRTERARFQPSTAINAGMVTVEPTRRAAITLTQTPRWVVDGFTGRLDGVLEFVCARFGLRPNPTGHQWDVHVTATPPGGGFVPHIDNGTPAIADRVLSWVYHVANGSFTGGELTLYDAREPRALLDGLTRRATVLPTPNTLVVFPSWLVHEITPVGSSSDSLGRTTVHGWLRWPRA
jgi:SM-20-related protein